MKGYRTSFGTSENRVTQEFETKDENDHFAKGLELMGINDFIKEYWQPYMKDWFRYHNDKEQKP